jgi:hypothetical protein
MIGATLRRRHAPRSTTLSPLPQQPDPHDAGPPPGPSQTTDERLAALAHDLKNDLHAIALAAALLDIPDLPADKRRAHLATIQACLRKIKDRLADTPGPPGAG